MNGQYPAIASDQCLYPAIMGDGMTCNINSYELGSTVQVSVLFTDSNGNPIDPTTVTLRIKNPDSTVISTTSVTHTGTGAYSYTWVPTEAGNYFYRWEGSGNLSSAIESQFSIVDSNVLD